MPRILDRATAISWRLLVIAAALVVAWLAVMKLRLVIFPTILALFVTAVLTPPARWLRSKGWPPLAATWAVMISAAGVVAAVGVGMTARMLTQFHNLGKTLGLGITQTRDWLVNGPAHLSPQQVDRYSTTLRDSVTGGTNHLVTGALHGATAAVETLGMLILAFVLTIFLVKDGESMVAWVLSGMDERRAEVVRGGAVAAWRTFQGYVFGTTINGVVNATLMTVGLLLLEVPLVFPIAVVTFYGAYFPLIGALIAGVVAVLVAFASKGILTALMVAGLAILIHQVEGNVLAPLVLGRAVRLHPIVILWGLAIGSTLGGILGAFIAVPAIGVVTSVVHYLRTAEASQGPKRAEI